MRSYRSATAPGLRIPFMERQQGHACRPMTACPWGWNGLNGKALLPYPGAVFGFCSSWAETPTGKLLRKLRRSYRQSV